MRSACMLALGIAVALIAWPLTVVHAQVGAERFYFDGVYFPAAVDSFEVTSVSRWADPGLGMVVQYGSNLDRNGHFSVFVYPIDEITARAAPREQVSAEYEKALAGIRSYQARESEDVNVSIDDEMDRPHTVDGDTIVGRQAVISLRQGSQSRQSLVYVLAVDQNYVKMRITYASSLRRVIAPRIDAFIAGIMAGLEVDPDGQRRAGGDAADPQ